MLARVVSSGGHQVEVWKLQTSPSPKLTLIGGGTISGGQFPGFFTSISSNGTASPIIWAISRPVSPGADLGIYAFNPESGGNKMTVSFKAHVGPWPNYNGDANLVPVVANGKVYVASYQQLEILGLKQGKSQTQPRK
jgi:hypothetical protein